jgi:hypothetical protein
MPVISFASAALISRYRLSYLAVAHTMNIWKLGKSGFPMVNFCKNRPSYYCTIFDRHLLLAIWNLDRIVRFSNDHLKTGLFVLLGPFYCCTPDHLKTELFEHSK